ncbi:hypothetical protein M8818_004432 [Zalaria obscura]|uniref:Uncharacterized protein n=1 Tax=Zalaria obscura TaxID=2024903 RepID=A0ACC3SCY3_9PEZI
MRSPVASFVASRRTRPTCANEMIRTLGAGLLWRPIVIDVWQVEPWAQRHSGRPPSAGYAGLEGAPLPALNFITTCPVS